MTLPVCLWSQASFPPPDFKLKDAKHKEEKSGVQVSGGNITIQSGVGDPTSINRLAFSADGRFLVAAKDFGRVAVWDLSKRDFLCAVDTGQGIVRAVAISADGKVLATGGERGAELKLWSLPEGRLIRVYGTFPGYVRAAFFGPTDDWLVIGVNAARSYVLDARSEKHIKDMPEEWNLLFSDGGKVVMTTNQSEYTLWSSADWTPQKKLPKRPNITPLAVDLEHDIMTYVVFPRWHVRLMRLSTGEDLPNAPSLELPDSKGAESFAAFTRDGRVVLGHSGARAWGWDTRSGRTCLSEIMYSEAGALSPDGKLLAGANNTGIMAKIAGAPRSDGVWVWNTEKLMVQCGLGQ
jgi:hypothetical protein